VCDADALALEKPSDVTRLTPADFAISDGHYGRTTAIYQCRSCGFLQCAETQDVVSYYQELEDPAYVESGPERAMQARGLLRLISRLLERSLGGLRLLDVGAGGGFLVEEARAIGVRAEGVEPSAWLCAQARGRGLPVHHGLLPHPDIRGPFDLVTLVDVIEHAPDPVHLLRQAAAAVKPGGFVVVVTPDVTSLAARLLGWRWWHFRVAHVGYFSPQTLERLLKRAGLASFRSARPGWVLPLSYLLERVESYLPRAIRLPRARRLTSISIPFNLRDSILVCARPTTGSAVSDPPAAGHA
jgi:SAM-dependent methyltransferase